jgi:hypothetical protein
MTNPHEGACLTVMTENGSAYGGFHGPEPHLPSPAGQT